MTTPAVPLPDTKPALLATDLFRSYAGGEQKVDALRGVSLTLEAGDFVAIMGPSGCGKSTLLQLCGAMDRPTSGRLLISGSAPGDLNDSALTALRRKRIGFVFQFFNLLPTLTIGENIALPLMLGGTPSTEAESQAREAAEKVGIGHRFDHRPAQVSGGEAQRAAIARAVVHRPTLLIADEPTGSLDSASSAVVLSLLKELNENSGIAILMATHDAHVASAAKRIVRMKDGRIIEPA